MTIKEIFGKDFPDFVRYCTDAGINNISALSSDICMDYCFSTGNIDSLSDLVALFENFMGAETISDSPNPEYSSTPISDDLPKQPEQSITPDLPIKTAMDEDRFTIPASVEEYSSGQSFYHEFGIDREQCRNVFVIQTDNPQKPFEIFNVLKLENLLSMSENEIMRNYGYDSDQMRKLSSAIKQFFHIRNMDAEHIPISDFGYEDSSVSLSSSNEWDDDNTITEIFSISAQRYRNCVLPGILKIDPILLKHFEELNCVTVEDILQLTPHELLSFNEDGATEMLRSFISSLSEFTGVNMESYFHVTDNRDSMKGKTSHSEPLNNDWENDRNRLSDKYHLEVFDYYMISVKQVEFSPDTERILAKNQIFSIGNLLCKSYHDLTSSGTFSEDSILEIDRYLSREKQNTVNKKGKSIK